MLASVIPCHVTPPIVLDELVEFQPLQFFDIEQEESLAK